MLCHACRGLIGVLCAASFLSGADLHLTVIEGQGAINNVRAHTARDPVVEVRDGDNVPLPGATVTFQTPADGPSVLFPDNARSLITQTDQDGRAVGRGLRPNSLTGAFQIRVTASYKSATGTAEIEQTNASPAEARSSKKYWLIGLLAGAAAGGAFAATHGGKSAAAVPPAQPTGSIVPGTPSFGPPH